MIPKVYILATCRKPELLPATLLVFKSLRVGFPHANITVNWNGLDSTDEYKAVGNACSTADVHAFNAVSPTIHHEWILSLLSLEQQPFYILDTDVVFWKSFESFDFSFSGSAMAGKFVPSFFDKFTNCITQARLHTSLMYLNPMLVKSLCKTYFSQFPDTPFNPKPILTHPCFHPVRIGRLVKNYFYDTCSMLFHAIGGEAFSSEMMDCYDHMNFGTISDLVAPHYPEYHWRSEHFAIFDNPELMRGSWKTDNEFYRENQP